uniref:Tumor protein p53-inducible nuclear protein 2 n=1 Tax=Scolopendra viridis TaxID=118503 RepID=A0A4D5R999_SCOVI
MLTGLSKLFFGSTKTETDELNQNSLPSNKSTKILRTKEDDGWIVVSSKEKKERDDISDFSADSDEDLDPNFSIFNSNIGHDFEMANEFNTPPPSQIISPIPPSTPSSLSHLDPEGSWYLTPPPCFIAGNNSNYPIMSPMENLLIEHPSMSVYQQTSQKSNEENDPPTQEVIGSKTSSRIQEASSSVSGGIQKKNRAKHVNLVNNRAGLIFTEIFKHEYDSQQNQEFFKNKHICRNQLERNNKVREFNAVGKRNRRKDRMKNPSGMNNNRKC